MTFCIQVHSAVESVGKHCACRKVSWANRIDVDVVIVVVVMDVIMMTAVMVMMIVIMVW